MSVRLRYRHKELRRTHQIWKEYIVTSNSAAHNDKHQQMSYQKMEFSQFFFCLLNVLLTTFARLLFLQVRHDGAIRGLVSLIAVTLDITT